MVVFETQGQQVITELVGSVKGQTDPDWLARITISRDAGYEATVARSSGVCPARIGLDRTFDDAMDRRSGTS